MGECLDFLDDLPSQKKHAQVECIDFEVESIVLSSSNNHPDLKLFGFLFNPKNPWLDPTQWKGEWMNLYDQQGCFLGPQIRHFLRGKSDS